MEKARMGGHGLWVKGPAKAHSWGVCGPQLQKYTRLIKQHWAWDRTLRVPADPHSPSLFTLTLPLLFYHYPNITKRWIPTSPWGKGEGWWWCFTSRCSAIVCSQNPVTVCRKPAGPPKCTWLFITMLLVLSGPSNISPWHPDTTGQSDTALCM